MLTEHVRAYIKGKPKSEKGQYKNGKTINFVKKPQKSKGNIVE